MSRGRGPGGGSSEKSGRGSLHVGTPEGSSEGGSDASELPRDLISLFVPDEVRYRYLSRTRARHSEPRDAGAGRIARITRSRSALHDRLASSEEARVARITRSRSALHARLRPQRIATRHDHGVKNFLSTRWRLPAGALGFLGRAGPSGGRFAHASPSSGRSSRVRVVSREGRIVRQRPNPAPSRRLASVSDAVGPPQMQQATPASSAGESPPCLPPRHPLPPCLPRVARGTRPTTTSRMSWRANDQICTA